jgi:hypothetical protein
MPPGFTASLASRLDGMSPLNVTEARIGDTVDPKRLLLAPGGAHLRVEADGRVRLSDDAPMGGLRPRADLTIADVAKIYGSSLVLVVLVTDVLVVGGSVVLVVLATVVVVSLVLVVLVAVVEVLVVVEMLVVVDVVVTVVVVGVKSPAWRSTAPMSQAAPDGRVSARWSFAGQPAAVPASTAGLFSHSRCVLVGPPLNCSAPICGATFSTSPDWVSPQVVSPARL